MLDRFGGFIGFAGRRNGSADAFRRAIAISFAMAGASAWSLPAVAQDAESVSAEPAVSEQAAAEASSADEPVGQSQDAAVIEPSATGSAAAPTSAAAQSGSLAGRVSSSATGTSLQGAIVEVIELGRTEVTGSDGRYQMLGLTPGTYTLRVTYYGFTEKQASVTIEAGAASAQAFDLVSTSGEVVGDNEIIVTARRREEGQAQAINQQRTATSIETIISKELFNQVNDDNIGNALQRLPGLSVDSDGADEVPRYVNIRGISTAFNQVQVDGQTLAVSGTGRGDAYGNTGRGFALDDLPSAAISTVKIVKAPTPDLDGGGLGGSINLITRSAFDGNGEPKVDFKTGGNYNALREDTNPEAAVTFSDVFELQNSRRLGFSITGSFNQNSEGYDNRDLDYNPLRPNEAINTGIATQPLSVSGTSPSIAEVLANTNGERPFVANNRGPKEALAYHEDTEYTNSILDRDRFGIAANFEYELNPTTTLYARPLVNKEKRDNDDRRYHKIMDNAHGIAPSSSLSASAREAFFLSRRIIDGDAAGPQVRLGEDPNARSTIDFVNENMGRSTLDASGNPRGSVRYTGTRNKEDISLYSLSFGSKHDFERSVLKFDANIGQAKKDTDIQQGIFQRAGFAFEYDRTDRFEARDDQYRVINNDYSYITDRDPFEVVVDPTKLDTLTAATVQESTSTITDNRISLSTDFEQEIDFASDSIHGSWKTGVKFGQTKREYDLDRVNYGLPGRTNALYSMFPWASFVKESNLKVDQQEMPYYVNAPALLAYAADDANRSIVTINDSTSLQNSTEQDYEVTERTYAAFGMATVQAGPVQVIAGARFEFTDFEATRNQFNNADAILTEDEISKATDQSDYTNILPAILVNYELTDNLIARGALTTTFARPQIADLVAVRTVNDTADPVTIRTGNPNLPALESDNIDVVLEYYRPQGFYSIGLFRKDITGFSFEAFSEVSNSLEFDGRNVATSTPLASGNARNEGLEVSGYQKLTLLPWPFNGIYGNANYTYTMSKANYPGRTETDLPTRGASKHLFAAGLGYEQGRVNVSVTYRFRSPYIEGLAIEDLQGENSFVEDDSFGETEITDVNSSFRIYNDISLYANVTNIFEETPSSRQGYLDTPEDIFFNQRRIAVGLKGTF